MASEVLTCQKGRWEKARIDASFALGYHLLLGALRLLCACAAHTPCAGVGGAQNAGVPTQPGSFSVPRCQVGTVT